jgi:DNA polymerase-3 subunit alpha
MYEDQDVFELFRTGNLTGIFQFASEGIQVIAKKIQPTSIDDVALAIALYRPGPLSSGIAFEIDKLRASPHKYHPLVDTELEQTGGVIVYQEQLMKVFQIVADATLQEADILRKLVGKKIVGDPKWKLYHNKFFKNGKTKGISQLALEELWKQIEGAGLYSFNKSHALSYALLAYDTAFYKVYYPRAFYAAMMQFDSGNTLHYILEAIESGFSIKPVDINVSTDKYEADDTDIVMPLSAVKGVGQVAVATIMSERSIGGKFISCEDFRDRIPRRQVNKRVVKAIFALGGFDNFADIEKLGLSTDEVAEIRSMKKRDVTREYLGFAMPTQKLMKAVRVNGTPGMAYGIVTHTYSGKARATGRKYFKVGIWPDQKTFFFKHDYEIAEGDIVKIYHKPKSQSGTGLEVVG